MPHARLKEVLDKARYFMSLQGYSDYVINLFMESGDTYNLTISDRFNAKRIIPLSMIYALPEATDIARMALRDVFGMGREGIFQFLNGFSHQEVPNSNQAVIVFQFLNGFSH